MTPQGDAPPRSFEEGPAATELRDLRLHEEVLRARLHKKRLRTVSFWLWTTLIYFFVLPVIPQQMCYQFAELPSMDGPAGGVPVVGAVYGGGPFGDRATSNTRDPDGKPVSARKRKWMEYTLPSGWSYNDMFLDVEEDGDGASEDAVRTRAQEQSAAEPSSFLSSRVKSAAPKSKNVGLGLRGKISGASKLSGGGSVRDRSSSSAPRRVVKRNHSVWNPAVPARETFLYVMMNPHLRETMDVLDGKLPNGEDSYKAPQAGSYSVDNFLDMWYGVLRRIFAPDLLRSGSGKKQDQNSTDGAGSETPKEPEPTLQDPEDAITTATRSRDVAMQRLASTIQWLRDRIWERNLANTIPGLTFPDIRQPEYQPVIPLYLKMPGKEAKDPVTGRVTGREPDVADGSRGIAYLAPVYSAKFKNPGMCSVVEPLLRFYPYIRGEVRPSERHWCQGCNRTALEEGQKRLMKQVSVGFWGLIGEGDKPTLAHGCATGLLPSLKFEWTGMGRKSLFDIKSYHATKLADLKDPAEKFDLKTLRWIAEQFVARNWTRAEVIRSVDALAACGKSGAFWTGTRWKRAAEVLGADQLETMRHFHFHQLKAELERLHSQKDALEQRAQNLSSSIRSSKMGQLYWNRDRNRDRNLNHTMAIFKEKIELFLQKYGHGNLSSVNASSAKDFVNPRPRHTRRLDSAAPSSSRARGSDPSLASLRTSVDIAMAKMLSTMIAELVTDRSAERNRSTAGSPNSTAKADTLFQDFLSGIPARHKAAEQLRAIMTASEASDGGVGVSSYPVHFALHHTDDYIGDEVLLSRGTLSPSSVWSRLFSSSSLWGPEPGGDPSATENGNLVGTEGIFHVPAPPGSKRGSVLVRGQFNPLGDGDAGGISIVAANVVTYVVLTLLYIARQARREVDVLTRAEANQRERARREADAARNSLNPSAETSSSTEGRSQRQRLRQKPTRNAFGTLLNSVWRTSDNMAVRLFSESVLGLAADLRSTLSGLKSEFQFELGEDQDENNHTAGAAQRRADQVNALVTRLGFDERVGRWGLRSSPSPVSAGEGAEAEGRRKEIRTALHVLMLAQILRWKTKMPRPLPQEVADVGTGTGTGTIAIPMTATACEVERISQQLTPSDIDAEATRLALAFPAWQAVLVEAPEQPSPSASPAVRRRERERRTSPGSERDRLIGHRSVNDQREREVRLPETSYDAARSANPEKRTFNIRQGGQKISKLHLLRGLRDGKFGDTWTLDPPTSGGLERGDGDRDTSIESESETHYARLLRSAFPDPVRSGATFSADTNARLPQESAVTARATTDAAATEATEIEILTAESTRRLQEYNAERTRKQLTEVAIHKLSTPPTYMTFLPLGCPQCSWKSFFRSILQYPAWILFWHFPWYQLVIADIIGLTLRDDLGALQPEKEAVRRFVRKEVLDKTCLPQVLLGNPVAFLVELLGECVPRRLHMQSARLLKTIGVKTRKLGPLEHLARATKPTSHSQSDSRSYLRVARFLNLSRVTDGQVEQSGLLHDVEARTGGTVTTLAAQDATETETETETGMGSVDLESPTHSATASPSTLEDMQLALGFLEEAHNARTFAATQTSRPSIAHTRKWRNHAWSLAKQTRAEDALLRCLKIGGVRVREEAASSTPVETHDAGETATMSEGASAWNTLYRICPNPRGSASTNADSSHLLTGAATSGPHCWYDALLQRHHASRWGFSGSQKHRLATDEVSIDGHRMRLTRFQAPLPSTATLPTGLSVSDSMVSIEKTEGRDDERGFRIFELDVEILSAIPHLEDLARMVEAAGAELEQAL